MTTEHPDHTQQQRRRQQYGQLVKLTHDPAATPGSRLQRALDALAYFTTEYALPWLRRRGRDIEDALLGGWDATAAWLRAAAYFTALALAFGAVGSVTPLAVGFWNHTMIGAHHDGVLATITRPVHDYLTAHTASLPADTATVWALWQIAGPALLIGAAVGFTSLRVLWVGYGGASAAMVWAATPDTGRPVATALAVACWLLLSTLALHGLRLRPTLSVPVRVRVKPEITVNTGAARPEPADDDPYGDDER
ncbi:hypothetical protein ACFRKE_31965 [Kitasatospora indigofera]|uniref:hypothetical protein n=1 Tax=Kitasatospora indigofera TaxID=67307 RepID=UPI003685AE9F